MPTIGLLLAEAATRLGGRLDAELLLLSILRRPRTFLFAHPEHLLDEQQTARFHSLVSRRLAGEPVAYLVGQRAFWTLELEVSPATLIPRPETETLIERALERIPADGEWLVADLGTGSGAIALALALERPRSRVIAVDQSDAALAVARRNAERHGVGNVEFRLGSWLEPVTESLDLVVSNPPYIRHDDPHLKQGDVRFEPLSALVAGADGLDAVRAITRQAAAKLRPGGRLLLEHGWDQGAAARAVLAEFGFTEIATWRDLGDRDRVAEARRA